MPLWLCLAWEPWAWAASSPIGLSGGLGGGMLGGYLGIGAASDEWDQQEHLKDTALGPGEILLAACAHDQPDTVISIMQKCGGRILETT